MSSDKDSTKKETLYQKEVKKQRSIEEKLRKEAGELKKQFSSQLLKLVTSSFGLVAALAWNEVIKQVISMYIEPVFGGTSGLMSLLIYAVFITLLTVFITYQLSKIVGDEKEKD